MDRQHPQTIEPGKPDPALPEFVQAPIAGATALSQTPDPDVPGRKFSARRFLSIVIGGIFLAEVAAMIILTRFSTLPYYLQTGIDAGIMVLLIFPIVYYFSLRPLLVQMEERRQTAAALRQSEERFAKAFHFSPTAFSISRKTDGGLIDVNESFVRLYGSKREDLVGHTSVELGMFPNPDERAELSRRTFEQQSAGGLGIREYEMETRAASGEARTVLISTEGIELDGEACILSSISDITERKHNEARLRWSYRALEVLSQCNEVLVRAEDETELLEEMCGIIVRVGGYRMAWVGFAEPDALKSVRPAAKAGFEEGYLDLVRISWGNNEHGNGPTGTSIRTGTIQVNQNFVTNPSMLPWRRAALERGYQSSISLPLRSNEDILGALTIYSESPEAFDTEEVTQLRRLAEDLGFGMQALRDRVRRTQAEARYREMALFPELNPDALLQVDASGCIRTCNPAAGALGIYMHSQLSDIMPDLPQVDLASCIANGTTGKISDVRLGERVLSWTIQGSPELGLAFLYSTDVTERKHAEDVIHRLSRIVEQTEDTVVVTNVEGAIEYVNPAFERITGYALEDVLGKTPRVLKSGLQGDPFYQRLWSTILGGEAFLAEIADRKKNGELFHEMKTITPLRNERGNITQFVATGKDITEHKRAEVELERRNRELQALSSAEHEQRQFSEALVAAALTLNKSLNLDEVLALILQEIEAVIPYQLADVALLEGKTFYDASHRGELSWPANLYGKRNGFPLEGFPVYHRMIVTGQPVLVYDTREEAEWVDISGLEGCRSFLSAPLLVDGKVIGFVSLFGTQPRFFTSGMTRRLVGFAAQAAVAIQNAWLFEQVQASAERLQSLSRRLVEVQESERLYVSRELHDEAGQLLTSLLVDLRLLEKRASQPDAIMKIVEEMENSIRAVLESLHRIAMALRPASLDHVGLVAALRQHTELVSEKHGLTIRYQAADLPERLPGNVESVLYRIAEEALTNIVRHARAASVDVVLMVRDGQLVLIVEDDGIGFETDPALGGEHLGLFGMRERTEMIGGKLTIESAPGRGTIIMVEVGYADPAAGGG